MSKKRRVPKFVSPPLNPKDFLDPAKAKRLKRVGRHKANAAMTIMARYFSE